MSGYSSASNKSDISGFGSSSLGEKYTPDQVNSLDRLYNMHEGPSENAPASLASDFSTWMTDQTNANNTWQNYANLVAKQAGGEGQGTILGNANLTPYQSILTAQQNTIGNPATTNAIQNTQKRVGAP